MAKFIVTGGLGFIGSNLVEYLLNLGHFVVSIDKISYSSNFFNTDSFKSNKNYKFFKADICNKQKISQIIKNNKPTCIFNLAAETHVDRSIDSSDNFINTNVLGVHSLLEILIKNKKIKLIHISTDEVYGDIQNNLRANEKTPYNPSNPYSATKAASDHLINSYINTYKINAIITNCCNNYGPKQNPEKFIPKMIFNIFNKKKLPLYGKGKNTREWIYVLDHCRALYKIYQKGKIGETYNIGSSQNFKNKDLIKKIITLAKKGNYYNKKSKITYIKDRPGHDLRYALNSQKIRKYIKWKPQVMINKGLLRTLEWYKNNKKFFKFIRNKNFINRLGKSR
jgi:dTDP-glucose 4,6-dehydratase